ncbi:hypothetical protein WJX75_007241 [Coccomyxa subellipsoidea]|uniref:Uncharacterized protein n=1 Tax=Coccomyxa subellipsoidea TaxID=248742 RepID=A0ABR2YW35_9CHLO
MCYAGGGQTHVEAFRRQFEADAEHFLRLCADEFGPGDLLLIVAPGMLGDWFNGPGRAICVAYLFPAEDELVSAANRAGNLGGGAAWLHSAGTHVGRVPGV